MRLFLALLLVSASANAAQTLFPYDPTPAWASFYVKADTVVALCVVGTTTCGPAKVIKAGTEASNNCGLTLSKPAVVAANASLECRPVSATTPPVVPPVALPAGVAQIALYGELFPQGAGMDVRMGKKDFTALSKVYRIPAGGGSYFCTTAVFSDVTGGDACFSVPAVMVTQECYPPNDIQITAGGFTSKNYKVTPVAASVGARWPYFASWTNPCTGKRQGKYFNSNDIANLAVANFLKLVGTSDGILAWVKGQSVEQSTTAEQAWADALLASETAATPVFAVSPISSGTRPYYTTTDGKSIGKKLGNVAVKTPCDQSKRLATTNYYWVPSVAGYAVCSAQ